MSVQINQYLIYGIKLPYKWHNEWEKNNEGKDFYDAFRDYMDDSAYDEKIAQRDGITMLFDGMDGNYIFIGYCSAKSSNYGHLGSNGIEIPNCPVPSSIKDYLEKKISEIFSINIEEFGGMKNYLVAHYR